MENQQEVCLSVGEREFIAEKDLLIEYSDYFRAMFSGNFIEREKEKIRIHELDEQYMEIILRYMELGFIDLSVYQLSTVKELFTAANYLQVTELIKQIDYCLEKMLSPENWMEIREIAQSVPSRKLEQVAVTYGVHQFQYMKPEYFPTLQELFFYLSHPNLHAASELDVYTFGVKWCEHWHQKKADTLMIVLCCLDYNQIRTEELEAMKDCKMMVDMELMESYYTCSDAKAVIEWLYELSKISKLSVSSIQENRMLVCKLNENEANYNRVFDLVRGSIERKLGLIPAVPMLCIEQTGTKKVKAELSQHHLFTYNSDFRLEPLVRIGEINCLGWVVTNWTPTKIVMCCGEYGSDTGKFERDVRVYDILKKEWIQHGVQIPSRRDASTVVVKDSLFILGGVGPYWKMLDSGVVYDLKERTFRTITMEVPLKMQSPAVCAHENNVYIVGHKSIYKYEKVVDGWKKVITTAETPSHIVSFNGYIYVAHDYFPSITRFRPEVDTVLEQFSSKCFPPMALCNIERKLVAFIVTNTRSKSHLLAAQTLDANGQERSTRIRAQNFTKYEFATGSCSVVLDAPATRPRASEIHKQFLMKYAPPTSSEKRPFTN